MLGDFNLPSIRWDETHSEFVLPNRATPFDRSFYELFLEVGLTQLINELTFTTSNNILDLILVSNTEIVGDVAILPSLPKCQHRPVVVDLYIEVNNDSNGTNVRLWNRGKYAGLNEELKRFDWESMFEGQTTDQYYGTFLNVPNNLVELYVTLNTRQEEVTFGCKSRPPRSLMKRRPDAWKKFVKARTEYGRNSNLTASTWRDYSSINVEYRNFSINRQCEIEKNLI